MFNNSVMCVDDFYDIFVINRSKRFHADAKTTIFSNFSKVDFDTFFI